MEAKGKTVWITGASSGIGRALAAEFAGLGANLVLSARNEKALRTFVAEQRLPPQRVLILPIDLQQYKRLPAAVGKALKKFGAVDILVNNGGISQRSHAHETDLRVYEQLMAVNYFGNIALTLGVLPHMRARKQGQIVTVSSVAGKFGTPLRSGYSASKFALSGFYEALRAENWRENIRVTVVLPGFIRTNVSENALTADGKPQGKMDRGQSAGMSAEACARIMARGILKGKSEIYVGGMKERFALHLSRHLPRVFARVIRKAKVT
ncbi:MAG: SDR family oxidoreductase [Spirochaetota bacterium]